MAFFDMAREQGTAVHNTNSQPHFFTKVLDSRRPPLSGRVTVRREQFHKMLISLSQNASLRNCGAGTNCAPMLN